jgi:hypothetical protein
MPNVTACSYVEGFYRTMEWADEVHRGVPGQQSRTAAIFRYLANRVEQLPSSGTWPTE